MKQYGFRSFLGFLALNFLLSLALSAGYLAYAHVHITGLPFIFAAYISNTFMLITAAALPAMGLYHLRAGAAALAPLFAFFVTRLGRGNFRVKVHAPIEIKKHDRAEREAVLLEAARKYLSLLEGNLLAHPEHWHHFDPWLGPEIHG